MIRKKDAGDFQFRHLFYNILKALSHALFLLGPYLLATVFASFNVGFTVLYLLKSLFT